MKIALCIKQVPDTSDIKWTEHNTIQREGVESIINPYDVYALEAALQIKNTCKDVEITALTMGPLQAEDMLKKAIAVGVDNGALITDKKFAGADTYATGKTLANAIKTAVPDFNIIICGQFAIDGDTATYVSKAFRPIVEHKCEKIIFTDDTAGTICEKILEFKAGANE